MRNNIKNYRLRKKMLWLSVVCECECAL